MTGVSGGRFRSVKFVTPISNIHNYQLLDLTVACRLRTWTTISVLFWSQWVFRFHLVRYSGGLTKQP